MNHQVSMRITLHPAFKEAKYLVTLFGTILYRYLGYNSVEVQVLFLRHLNDTDATTSELITIDFSDDPLFLELATRVQQSLTDVFDDTDSSVCCRSSEACAGLISRRLNHSSCKTISLYQFDDGAVLEFEGCSEMEQIHLFAEHLIALATDAIEDSRSAVSKLAMLNSVEMRDASNANHPVSKFKRTTISTEFERQTFQCPSSPALRWCDESVTYSQLNERIRRAAIGLQQLVVVKGTLVGVCLDDPIAVAVTYLAIVKAGGVIVALDHEWPADLMHQRIRETAPTFLVTTSRCEPAGMPDSIGIVRPDSLTAEGEHAFVAPDLTPDDAAYVIFTSGSMGLPKGIVGLHRTITSARHIAHQVEQGEIFALSADLAFGSGLIGLFFALLRGACTVLVSRTVSKDILALVQVWRNEKVTRLVLVAPQLRQLALLSDKDLTELESVNTVALSGAALTPDLLQTAYRLFPRACIINAYSSLEIGTMSTRWESTPENRARVLNVGRPLPNIRIYIVGPRMNLLPLGMPGEIVVGSADLSQGYIGRDDWTAERFMANPFYDPEVPRVYRTGDVGRLLRNGELEYLGRVDNQIKVRGRRVEVEEIEALLYAMPEIHQAAVIVERNIADGRLTAFLSAKPNQSISIKPLRTRLENQLPDYMVPAMFIICEELPLTRNGKIDRRALTSTHGRPELDSIYIAPRNELEVEVKKVWERVLEIQGIGVRDHFLEIGGDSLLAVQIAIYLQERFDCSLPPIALFARPTVEELAAEIAMIVESSL